mmetsp:Transcript_7136/g.17353  ORF Transcript_7136/g.17353 Transcript_7136/m.17353 type:complete len:261 (+) Transcript_7136:1444-2226(+)
MQQRIRLLSHSCKLLHVLSRLRLSRLYPLLHLLSPPLQLRCRLLKCCVSLRHACPLFRLDDVLCMEAGCFREGSLLLSHVSSQAAPRTDVLQLPCSLQHVGDILSPSLSALLQVVPMSRSLDEQPRGLGCDCFDAQMLTVFARNPCGEISCVWRRCLLSGSQHEGRRGKGRHRRITAPLKVPHTSAKRPAGVVRLDAGSPTKGEFVVERVDVALPPPQENIGIRLRSRNRGSVGVHRYLSGKGIKGDRMHALGGRPPSLK